MNDLINDEQFAALFKETIASDYKDALLFMNDGPDISLMKFRKILESLCLRYKQHNNHEFSNDNLFDQIEELADNRIITGINRKSFHDVRKLTNPGVHITGENRGNNAITPKDELINNAIQSRKGVLNILEHAFIDLKIDKKLPRFEQKAAGGQEIKNLLFNCLYSSDNDEYFRLGELYEEFADCYERQGEEGDDFILRSNSMFVFAVESYKTSFQFSSKHSIDDVIESQGKGISISPKSYEALFNYSLLCLKGKVEKHNANDAKIMLRALIKRGFTEAYPYLGWQSYIDEEYRSAYKYLNHKKAPQNVFTYHKLGFIHLEGKACSVDTEAAINNFEKAAELGDADSMFQLGKLYHCSELVDKDDGLAQMYLHKAVSMGNVDAVMYLDEHYLKIREKLIDDMEGFLDRLTQECQPERKVPYRAPVKQKSNDLCSCGSGDKYKKCHGA